MRISGIEVRNPYRPCTTGRLHLASWGGVTSKISLVLVHFGLIKLKPLEIQLYFQYTLPVERPCLYSCVEAIWASLVATSKSFQ